MDQTDKEREEETQAFLEKWFEGFDNFHLVARSSKDAAAKLVRDLKEFHLNGLVERIRIKTGYCQFCHELVKHIHSEDLKSGKEDLPLG